MAVPLETGWRHPIVGRWPVCPELMDAPLPESSGTDCHDGSEWLSAGPFTDVADEPLGACPDPFASVLVRGWRFDGEAPDGSVRDTDVSHDARTLHTAGTSVETDTLLGADGVDRPTAEPVCDTSELRVEAAAGRRASGVSAGGP